MVKEKLFSVTVNDCEVQTFRSGGNGGQNQNVRDTGVRIIHHPSGARGESREERSQLQNKRTAFRRMAESAKFKIWITRVVGNRLSPEQQVEKDMQEANLKVEVRDGKVWKVVPH
jgi:protein subunit release factor B